MQKQTRGVSGMISFRIKGGLREAKTFLENVKVFMCAESLGAVESLAEHPAIMTHASVPPDERVRLGITDSLIRLSVGLEDEADLLKDIQQALDKAVGTVLIYNAQLLLLLLLLLLLFLCFTSSCLSFCQVFGPSDPIEILPILKKKYEEEKANPALWQKPGAAATPLNRRAVLYSAGGVHGRYEQPLPEELISSEPKPTPYVNDPRRAALLESGGVHGRYDAPITPKAAASEPEQNDNQHRATAFENGGVHGRYDNLSITGRLSGPHFVCCSCYQEATVPCSLLVARARLPLVNFQHSDNFVNAYPLTPKHTSAIFCIYVQLMISLW